MNKTVVDKGFKGNKTRNNKLVGVIMQLNVWWIWSTQLGEEVEPEAETSSGHIEDDEMTKTIG
jgi:hypothetical protein